MKLIRQLKASFCNVRMEDFHKTKFTKLSNRSLLILNGPDSAKLLQGLMTNDIRGIKQVSIGGQKMQRVALYTLFLQPKGKVVTDAFVFRPRQYIGGKTQYSKEELWIDVPRQTKSFLKQHLRRHMWKKQVQLHDVQTGDQEYKPSIYSGYNQGAPTMEVLLGGSVELEEQQRGEDGTYANLIYFDPRGKDFGMRIISMQPELDIEGHFEHFSQNDQGKLFQKLGQIPIEHSSNRLPFQFNYDLMNAISLKKGCFLGQEIVSRGLLAGIVRRRSFPFVLTDSNQVIPSGSIIKSNDEQLGKVLFSSQGQGTALINYISLLQKGVKWPLKFDSPVTGQLLNPFEEKLNKYYSQMKGKQKILEDLQL